MQNYFSIQFLWVVKSLWLTSKKIPLFMRVFILFLVCSIGLSYAADSYAQKAMISIDVHNQRVEDVLKEIEEQSDFDFFFNNKHVDLNRRVSVSADKSNIFNVLKEIFAGTNVKYSVLDKKIILSVEAQSPQQEKKVTVSGTVTDAKGEPVIGASIMEKGVKGNGTITDFDGRFQLSVSSSNTQLDITYIGYQSQTVTAQAGKSLNITLLEDARQLDEVVVVGYGTQNKKTLTGAVSVMDMGDIETSTVSTVAHALAGKAAGLRVNQLSAQPGGASKFRIRGEASTGAGNDPLFVIDGFPVSSSNSLGSGNIYDSGSTDNVLESLSPDDIESITVLKDAASTAIYGSRAGHGVILITTKRGKSGKPRISYSGSGSVQQIRSQYQMLDVKSFMIERNEQEYENYLASNGLGIYEGYVSKPELIGKYTPIYSPDQINQAKGTDWLDEVTRTGYMQQHNMSINGGTEATRYLVSVNYMHQDGVVKNNAATRLSARVNLDQDINKMLTVGLSASYAQNKYDNVPLGDKVDQNSGVLTAAIQANPSIPVYNEVGEYYIDPARSNVPNPVSLLDIVDNTVKDRIMGSAYALFKPLKGLELKAQLGADRRSQKRSSYIPKTTLSGANENGIANIAQESSTDYLMDLTATYSRTFGEHNLKALVGYSYQRFTGNSVKAGNSDFIIDGFEYNNLGAGANPKPTVGSNAWLNCLGSYFARVNYSWKGRYLLEGSLRIDGASNFEPEHRWGYFPSVSAGWLISEEKFMKKLSWLPYAKLRASYGQTGNSNVGNRVNSYYSVGHGYVLGDLLSTGVYISELGNPAITWETTTEYNVGLDLGFLNNRIRVTAEYFNRTISDLLVTAKPIPSYNEVTSISGNIGSTQSKGYEFTLNTVNFDRKDFTWNTTLTLSHYEDRWKERDPNWKPKAYESKNDPIRAWWDYHAIGIMQVGEQAPAAQADLLPGMVKLADIDENGILDERDMVYQGNGDPKIIYGMNNAFTYKNFDFSIYFYGEAGRKVGASYLKKWNRIGTGQNVSVKAVESFDSRNITSTHPTYIMGSGNNWGDYYNKSIYYIRCGSISLGYKIPVKEKYAKNLRVFAEVSNPFVFTNWDGLDPETDNGNFSYPNVTSYSFGLNITF